MKDNKVICSKHNKGFSLLEILMAVLVLAAIMTPLLRGFITTAKINKSSREYMGGTDVAESVLEGITNKTFKQISDSMDKLESGGSLTDELCLSGISSGFYNDVTNTVVLTGTTGAFSLGEVSNVKKNSFEFAGAAYTQNDLFGTNSMLRQMTQDFTSTQASLHNWGREAKLIEWRDPEHNCVFLCYTGVNVDNRIYTVGVSIFPCAQNDSSSYIPYGIYVHTLMYDVTKAGTANPMIQVGDLTSGIRSLQ